ncbi:MAG: hypothetical protein JSU79_10275, partial [Dehalococcoidales bacterium]
IYPVRRDDLFEGIVALELPGKVVAEDVEESPLYKLYGEKPRLKDIKLTAVPYYTWANRGAGQMRVWIPII